MKSFNVICYNINKDVMESFDIMPYLNRCYNRSSDKPKTFDEFKEFVKKESMYQWWARCEYEIILSDWPSQKHHEKWDVHKQVLMNLDIITEILINNIKNGKGKI